MTKGRVTVVLPRTELQKLFASDLTVLRAQYQEDEEQLLVTVEGEDLPQWYSGTHPTRIAGQALDSAYVMFERQCRHSWAREPGLTTGMYCVRCYTKSDRS